ncbi:hypothetical protein D3C87_2084290 [compost metagenome]
MDTFADGILRVLSPVERAEVLTFLEQELKPQLFQGGQWVMDYRRIRVAARKNS